MNHANLAIRAERLRLEFVRRDILPSQSAWYFEYPVVATNNYTGPPPTSLPFPITLVFVDTRHQPRRILLSGCVHSCQSECPTCRVSDLELENVPTGFSLVLRRGLCLIWNHADVLNVDNDVPCPGRPDPDTGKFGAHTCCNYRL